MTLKWLLLIYTVPAEPSRIRATIWRELKKAGAVYLRDGVCALPEAAETEPALAAIAARVADFGGQATLARSVQLEASREDWIRETAGAAREAEYDDIRTEIRGFLNHIRQEQ